MEAIYIIFGIVIYAGGLITGVYISSQVELHIEKRINAKEKKQLHWSICWILWTYINNNYYDYNYSMSTAVFAIVVIVWWFVTYTLIKEHGN